VRSRPLTSHLKKWISRKLMNIPFLMKVDFSFVRSSNSLLTCGSDWKVSNYYSVDMKDNKNVLSIQKAWVGIALLKTEF